MRNDVVSLTSQVRGSQSLTAPDHQEHLVGDPTVWAGPVTGVLKLYHYNFEAGAIYQDGPRYVGYSFLYWRCGDGLHPPDALFTPLFLFPFQPNDFIGYLPTKRHTCGLS